MGVFPEVPPGVGDAINAVTLPSTGLAALDGLNTLAGGGLLPNTPLTNFLRSPAFKKLGGANSALGAMGHFNDLVDAKTPQDFAKAGMDLSSDYAKAGTFALKNSVKAATNLQAVGRKIGATGVERLGEKMVSRLSSAGLANAEALATPILDAGLWALTAMSLMLGFGDPETGDRLGQGAEQFTKIADLLAHAIDNSWEGSASTAYGERNSEQQERVSQLGNLDTALQRIIQTEAEQLGQTSDSLDICSDVLTICIPIAIALNLIPIVGQAESIAFQIGAVAGVAPVASLMMNMMAAHAMQNAMQVQKQVQGYSKVASKARPGGSPPTAPPGNSSLPKGGDGRKAPDGSGKYPKGSAPGDINMATGGSPNARNMGATTPGSQASPQSPGQSAGAKPLGGTSAGTGAPHSSGTTHAPGGSAPTATAPSAPASPGGPAAPTTASPGGGSPGVSGGPAVQPATATAPRGGGGTMASVSPASSNPGAEAGPGVRTPGGQSGVQSSVPGAAAGPVRPGFGPAPVGPSSGTGTRAPVVAETEADPDVEVRAT